MKNNFIMVLQLFLFLLIYIAYVPYKAHADLKNISLPTVSVINQIRGEQLGLENEDLLESLKGQWRATEDTGVPATWLWQYSAIEDKNLTNFAKKEMKHQEFGIFLEIDPNFAERAGVRYRGAGPWYFSDGLFLVSYEQEERKKLIAKVFEEFKNEFGYYPKTVGAWWVGAESINYMQKKYGIVAVLQCADQFNTDKYSIWGTPWSIPYIPSERNSAIPASSFNVRDSNVVMLQWATRDPVMAYGKSVNESTYSIQDFAMKKYAPDKYISYLKSIYLKKPMDQIVIGLESGFYGPSYEGAYKRNLQVIKQWEEDNEVQLQTASAYAADFLKEKSVYPPTHYFLTKGFDNNDQAFWYHSQNYRVGIQKKGKSISLIDLRDYTNTPSEDHYILPNTDPLLRINTKSFVDSARFENQKITLASSTRPLTMKTQGKNVLLLSNDVVIAIFAENKVTFNNPTAKLKEVIPAQVSKGDPTLTHVFTTYPKISIEIVIFLMILVYIFFCIQYKQKNNIIFHVSIYCLVFNMIIFYPIYSSGQTSESIVSFSDISLNLFHLLSILPFDPGSNIFLLYQFVPILLVFVMHFIISHKITRAPVIIGVYLFIAVFLFSYLDNYPQKFIEFFNLGKKAKILLLGYIGVSVCVIVCIALLYKTKRDKTLAMLLIIISFSFIYLNKNTIFAQKTNIVAHFELEALDAVYDQKKDVLYFKPLFKTSSYHSITPLIAKDIFYSEILTSTSWNTISSSEKKRLNDDNKLLVIPRYQGGEIYESEEKNLTKIFDNSQIVIYKKK